MGVRVGCLVILTLVAAAAGAASVVPVSPGRASTVDAISQACPTFSWESVVGATRLDLVVYEVPAGDSSADLGKSARPVIEVSLPGRATSWTPRLDQCLEPGGSFAWSVRALSADLVGEWATPTLFSVVDKAEIGDVQEAVRVLRRYLDERATQAAGAPPAAVVPKLLPAPAAVPRSEPPQFGILETNLDVEGRAEFDVLRLADTAGNGVFWDIAEDASNDLVFTYVGDRVKFRSNGFVGIGTVGPPQQTLEVNGVVRLTLDTGGATTVCIDAEGDLSNCGLDPIEETQRLTKLVEALNERIKRLEVALCAAGVDSGSCGS